MEDWPSKNVARGGFFQPAKVNYSPETRDFLKTLINETKMTTMQRNKITYSLRTGDPLPPISSSQNTPKKKEYDVIIRPGSSKRRSYETIKNSGAYDKPTYKSLHPTVDREVLKQQLADRMAYGKELKKKPPEKPKPLPKKKRKDDAFINRYDMIKTEIKEREEWLATMEALGEGHKHRLIIQQQIQEKLRELEKLKLPDSDGY